MDKKPYNQKQKKRTDIKIRGIDTDKAEYQEIVLSQSNYPDRKYFDKNYNN